MLTENTMYCKFSLKVIKLKLIHGTYMVYVPTLPSMQIIYKYLKMAFMHKQIQTYTRPYAHALYAHILTHAKTYTSKCFLTISHPLISLPE